MVNHDKYMTVSEACRHIKKSERTVRRWISENPHHVIKDDGKCYIDMYAIDMTFGQASDRAIAKESKEALQLANTTKSLDTLTAELRAKDEIIKNLLSNKKKTPFYIILFFLILGFIASIVVYGSFYTYTTHIKKKEEKFLQSLTKGFEQQAELRQQISKERINSLKQINEIQNQKIEELKTQVKELKLNPKSPKPLFLLNQT